MPYKDKCFSKCKEFEKDECNPPRCKYINGPTLEYCRISHKYKMNKPKCNVTRRIKKSEQKIYATKKIGEMIKRSGKFLQTICSDAGVCIAFGQKTDEITNFFNGYTDFNYALTPINKIGMPSANGFVKEITYEKQGYSSHAILKSAQNPEADNLVYEYLVGIKFINRVLKQFPCFIQTYGLYFYKDNLNWKIMKATTPVHKSNLKNLILQNSINYSKACNESKYAAVLIQHLHNVKTLYQSIAVTMYTRFLKNDLLYVLFIIYHTLASLSKTFTHYDLHDSNVLLYEPVKGKYIQYNYHNSDGSIINFYSPYIPKIIDYGRSFFDNGNVNSDKIYKKICSIKDCDPNCGEDYGFTFMNPNSKIFITSSKKNESHDLRLLKILQENMDHIFNIVHIKPTEATFIETDKILNKIVYGEGINNKENKQYGTQENLNISNKKIYNIYGAYLELKAAIELPSVTAENQKNYNKFSNLLGTLHIYNDGRPMKYESM